MTHPINTDPSDPYSRCEEHCNHDLARGCLVEEELLSGEDGEWTGGWQNGSMRGILGLDALTGDELEEEE